MLNGFDRNGQQVLDEADFFSQEGFRVGHAAEHAVKARHGIDAGSNFVMGREEILAGLLIAELRLVGQDGSKLPLELVTDFDDKRRPNVVIERRVDNLERTMRSERTAYDCAQAGLADS